MKPKKGIWVIKIDGDMPAMKTRFADQVNVNMSSGAYSVQLPVLDVGRDYRKPTRLEITKSLIMSWAYNWFGKKITL